MIKTVPRSHLQNTAETLKAMAHPERLAILDLLCKAPKGKLTVKAIYQNLEAQQAVVSRHLIILKKSGIVRRSQEGQKTFYGLLTKKKKIEMLLECFDGS